VLFAHQTASPRPVHYIAPSWCKTSHTHKIGALLMLRKLGAKTTSNKFGFISGHLQRYTNGPLGDFGLAWILL
jgi:hypothetical protein